ncbi:hypothetical protein ABLT82_02355 [Acinetobacter pittii]|uniref:hypothetical protein n=1 Tax=Acinetobacter pittii TaxID=48296 RepID=UPI0010237016|nr:hypothetical protein [Acinetobacter pittii]MDC4303643.1 hypothetical protein [Acinetobacter baumannii]MDC4436154.1 hypothetical protein [Acinetobacter baumannii]MDC4849087.1 hypothetical protein [Acinetobacter baumannii]MDC4893145.1 hypothetical protein [Acinetobacter baumannii]MDC4897304.1 hypothetical protein [Acinetobacter baumannii]
MFDSKKHYENKLVFDNEANNYLDDFKASLGTIVFLGERNYVLTKAHFYSPKKIVDSNYYSREFEEFVDIEVLVEDLYPYHATLGRKFGSKSWQYIPNTAY